MRRGVLILCALVYLYLVPACSSEDGDKEDVGTVIGIDLGTTYSW